MKCIAIVLAIIGLSACADTEVYNYSGSQIYQGTGGASRNVDGVELWVNGTPPRRYRIIGYITDQRLGGPLAMAGRNRGMASAARKAGGDAILLMGEQTNGMGSYTTGSAMAFGNGSTATAIGNATTIPIIQRQATYYIIKYVD